MKVKVKIIQTDTYEKEMTFDVNIEVTNDKNMNERQARKQIIEEIEEKSIDLMDISNTFVTSNTDIEFLEWNAEQ